MNGCKSIIRNNLALLKHSEIYLIQNFQKHCQGSNDINIQIWKGKIYISKKLMIFESDKKKWWKKFMSEKNQGLQHRGREREVEVGTLLLGNDKNNTVAYKVLKITSATK